MIELIRHSNGLLYDSDDNVYARNYVEKYPEQAEIVVRFSLDLPPPSPLKPLPKK